jgi:hypothetical protein
LYIFHPSCGKTQVVGTVSSVTFPSQPQDNIALLKEQIQDLAADKERAEKRLRDRDIIHAKLEVARSVLTVQ